MFRLAPPAFFGSESGCSVETGTEHCLFPSPASSREHLSRKRWDMVMVPVETIRRNLDKFEDPPLGHPIKHD